MAYRIGNECIMCGQCEIECPVDAIYDSGLKYDINADKCVECGACLTACPISAPVLVPENI